MIIVNNLAAFSLHNGNIYVKSDMLGMPIANAFTCTLYQIVPILRSSAETNNYAIMIIFSHKNLITSHPRRKSMDYL